MAKKHTNGIAEKLHAPLIHPAVGAYLSAVGVNPDVQANVNKHNFTALMAMMAIVDHLSISVRRLDPEDGEVSERFEKYRMCRKKKDGEGPTHFVVETPETGTAYFQLNHDDGLGGFTFMNEDRLLDLRRSFENQKLHVSICLNDSYYHVEDEMRKMAK